MDSNSLTTPSHDAEDTFQYALSSNGAWAGYKAHQNPQFFSKLAGGQSPQIRKSSLPCPRDLYLMAPRGLGILCRPSAVK